MISQVAYVASTRFGLGPRPDEVAAIGGSAQAWLMQQIRAPQIISPAFSTLPSSAQNMQELFKLKQEKQQSDSADAKQQAQKEKQQELKHYLIDELRAKVQLAMTTPTPFYERLVDFWSNHFSVSVKKGPVRALAGAFEREAIRPHITGKFADMLLAVAHHPAMLIYLDNAQSIGPDSIAGERRGKGLNENLAREIMELHTLGVGGGYTQADVTTFAKVLTGWSIAGPNTGRPGIFDFAPRRHEPGTQYIMGKGYGDNGEAQGVDVLRDLAMHPKTAHHIATKLARHFVADEPPIAVVDRLAAVFRKTGGDLPALYEAIVALPEAWDVQANPKIKGSYDLAISAARASGSSADEAVNYTLAALKFLGNIPFTADSPAGFSDVARDIVGPDEMIRRVQWAQMAALKLAGNQSADALAALTIAPVMSETTRSAIASATNPREAVAIVFGSPEFQRR